MIPVEKIYNLLYYLSNDTDLKTPLKIVKQKLNKKVVIITPTKSLKNSSDSVLSNTAHVDLKKLSQANLQIEEKHLKNSQFPDTINKISKPKTWTFSK